MKAEPKEVAAEFLQAVERDDSSKAKELASKECDTELEMLFGHDQRPKHREVYIGKRRSTDLECVT
ncbi:MAG: hypothetical protein U0176_11320 [Bacteroidia bacterium]